jgi:glycosyltransferase involved in cell wall biosynthesis
VLEGGLFALSSTAYVNREAGRVLLQRGKVDLATRPLEGVDAAVPAKQEVYRGLEATRNRRFRKPAHLHVWHQWPPSPAVPPAGKWVVWQGWEYGSLPRKIATLLQGVDEVWTYSSHCAREFEADGIPRSKIRVIPLGVDPDRFHPGGDGAFANDDPMQEDLGKPGRTARFRSLTGRKTVFLFVGGTIWRKGIDLLLSAFCRAFTRHDDVALLVKEMGSASFYKDYNLTEAVERLASFPEAPKIVLLEDMLSDDEMPALYRACDCLVHPYRGEGFGLPVLEAMACGLPVIATEGGACDDFLAPDSGFYLPGLRKEIPLPLETVRPAWVLEPDRDALVEQLRKLAHDPDDARTRARAESERIRREWTWRHTAMTMEARCKALQGAL